MNFDLTDWKRREGMTFVCELPRALGRVVKLAKKGGRVVATTESGIEFIVPLTPPAQIK